MSVTHWDTVKALFSAALELPCEDRAAYLTLETGGDPARFLFWDAVHPTTRGHEILAEEAPNRLIDYYSPRRGRGDPPALVHSLNGLVRAGKGN